VISTDPPFRIFTNRLYIKLLIDLTPPENRQLNKGQLKKLVIAYKTAIKHAKRMIFKLDASDPFNPYYYLMDIFRNAVTKFKPVYDFQEFHRSLA
jgi:hypothetical protein